MNLVCWNRREWCYTIDFTEKVRINKEADKTLEAILSKRYDTFDLYSEVSKITDLEVAKMVIKRLLDKLA